MVVEVGILEVGILKRGVEYASQEFITLLGVFPLSLICRAILILPTRMDSMQLGGR
jgi:hypothetical protein